MQDKQTQPDLHDFRGECGYNRHILEKKNEGLFLRGVNLVYGLYSELRLLACATQWTESND
jgi:hypothetical protein